MFCLNDEQTVNWTPTFGNFAGSGKHVEASASNNIPKLMTSALLNKI